MSSKKWMSYFLILSFLLGSVVLSSCGSNKKQTRVHSKSGMGNSKHKNKHVWGK